jgi:hypothetical protein
LRTIFPSILCTCPNQRNLCNLNRSITMRLQSNMILNGVHQQSDFITQGNYRATRFDCRLVACRRISSIVSQDGIPKCSRCRSLPWRHSTTVSTAGICRVLHSVISI